MFLHIDETTTVAEVQKELSSAFPRLKLEFYDAPHHLGTIALRARRIAPETLLYWLHQHQHPAFLEVLSWYTTARLEREFENKFGLYVQVFRKERSGWVPLSPTDGLTLADEVAHAHEAATFSILQQKKRPALYEYL